MSTVRGNAGIVFKLALPPAAAIAYDDEVKNVRLTAADKDDSDLTFAEAAGGETKDYTVVVTAVQDTADGSLWRLLWDNPGEEFTLTYGPNGNAVATASDPHFLMTVKADGRPELGTEARRTKQRGDFEYSFEVTTAITIEDGS